MKPHLYERLCLLEKFSCQCDDEVCSVAAFSFLHFASHHNHFGRRMLHFHFLQYCCCITGHKNLIDVVHDHLLHAYNASLLITIRSQGGFGDIWDFLTCIDVLEDCLLQTRVMTRSLLQHWLETWWCGQHCYLKIFLNNQKEIQKVVKEKNLEGVRYRNFCKTHLLNTKSNPCFWISLRNLMKNSSCWSLLIRVNSLTYGNW